MRMRSGKEGSWRKNGKRAVSPIIATILLVAITVVLAAVLYVLISGLVRGPGNTPLGSAVAFNSAQIGACSSTCTYTITVSTVSTGVTLNSMHVQLVTSGSAVSSITSVTAFDGTGCKIASVTTNGGAWTQASGAGSCGQGGYPTVTTSSNLVSGDQFILLTPTVISQSGYTLNFIGTGSYSGTVGVPLP